jgi:predicted RNA-binding Zn-ribbon protein involved in translation (DUF1610 family)
MSGTFVEFVCISCKKEELLDLSWKENSVKHKCTSCGKQYIIEDVNVEALHTKLDSMTAEQVGAWLMQNASIDGPGP